MTGFVVFGMPRSRTYWLSRYLSYGGWGCGHDEVRHLRSLEDVAAWFAQPLTGTVETAAASWWRMLPAGVRVATVRRPIGAVLDSLIALDLGPSREAYAGFMARFERKLDQIERRVPDVLTVTFDELATEAGCARIFEHCLPFQHDHAWWERCAAVNLQTSVPALARYYAAHKTQLDKLAAMAKQRTLARMMREPAIDGVEIQEEGFDAVLRDGGHLFREHSVVIGEEPEDYLKLNFPLMKKLEEVGCLTFVTARSNGRMFGYLQSVISPSLERRDRMVAAQTIFYSSGEIPRLGMKLQAASVKMLKERGVHEIHFRAGIRGSGPKTGAIYRRLGAEFFGQYYRMEISA